MNSKHLSLTLSLLFLISLCYGQNVGIGTTSPQVQLEVRDDQSSELRLSLSNNNWGKFQYSSNEGLRIEAKNEGVEFTPALLIGKELRFYSGPFTTPERMRITQNGQVGIGTTSPQTALHVVGNASNAGTARFDNVNSAGFSGAYFDENGQTRGWIGHVNENSTFAAPGTMQIGSSTGDLVFSARSDGFFQERMRITTIGRIGIAVSDPAHPLHMASGAHCSSAGVWVNASDRRLKTNIQPITYGLPEILALRPVNYNMKESGEPQVGFIAQEVQEIIPELITGTEGHMEKGETLGMSYGNLSAILVKAIQTQQETIDRLQAENSKLQYSVNRLEAAVFGERPKSEEANSNAVDAEKK
jgi:hypothetical protein